MKREEELRPHGTIRSILPDRMVTVIGGQSFGSEAQTIPATVFGGDA